MKIIIPKDSFYFRSFVGNVNLLIAANLIALIVTLKDNLYRTLSAAHKKVHWVVDLTIV